MTQLGSFRNRNRVPPPPYVSGRRAQVAQVHPYSCSSRYHTHATHDTRVTSAAAAAAAEVLRLKTCPIKTPAGTYTAPPIENSDIVVGAYVWYQVERNQILPPPSRDEGGEGPLPPPSPSNNTRCPRMCQAQRIARTLIAEHRLTRNIDAISCLYQSPNIHYIPGQRADTYHHTYTAHNTCYTHTYLQHSTQKR